PLVSFLTGVNINRRTEENVRKGGLDVTAVEQLALRGVFKLIEARVPDHAMEGRLDQRAPDARD
ncbi:MAG: hypothetical protein GWN58_51230, partial [Anaerolineae bacterium]|nr:hypothetical protein [Anaerolineae bacterium]